MTCRSGWKPIEFEKGCAVVGKLPSVIDTLIAAVRKQLAQASKEARPPMPTRK